MQPAISPEAAPSQPPVSTSSAAILRAPAGWGSVVLSSLALVLLLTGIFGNSWMTSTDEVEILGVTTELEVSLGLNSGESKICAVGECEITDSKFSKDRDDCEDYLDEWDITEGDEFDSCKDMANLALAGLVGTIILWVSFVAGLLALTTLVLYQLGRLGGFALTTPAATGLLTLLAILTWGLIKPDNDALDLGTSFWYTFFSGVFSLTAGALPILGSLGLLGMWWDTTPRPAGIGARAAPELGEGQREFVIRELRHGNDTLSLISGDDLLRLVTAKRDSGSKVAVEQHMMVKLTSLEAFSHYRFDWLDTGRLAWWTLTLAGLIALPFTAVSGAFVFMIGLLLTLAQIADPEYITFKASSGNYRLLVYRLGTNRALTNASMDLIDTAVENLLTGGELDSAELDSVAERIESERETTPVSAASATPVVPAASSVAPTSVVEPTPAAPPTEEPPTSEPAPAPTEAPPTPAAETPPPQSEPAPAPLQAPAPAPAEQDGPPPFAPPTGSGETQPPQAPPPSSSPQQQPLAMSLPPSPTPAPPTPPPPPAPAAQEFGTIPPPPPVSGGQNDDFSSIPSPPPPGRIESTAQVDKDELLDLLK